MHQSKCNVVWLFNDIFHINWCTTLCVVHYVVCGALRLTKPLGIASQHIYCLSQARINWEGCSRKGIWHKKWGGGDGGGLLISPDGVAPCRIVSVSGSVIFPCTMKSRSSLLALSHLGGRGKRAVKRLWCGGFTVCRHYCSTISLMWSLLLATTESSRRFCSAFETLLTLDF